MERRPFSLRGILFVATLLLLLTATSGGLAVQKAPVVFMATDLEGRETAQNFDCHDKIYIHAAFLDLKKGTHEVSVKWINPKGKRQDYSNLKFSESNYRVWFWLKLKPAFGGKLLKSFAPSFGMEDFIGAWNARLYLDGKLVSTKFFYVAC